MSIDARNRSSDTADAAAATRDGVEGWAAAICNKNLDGALAAYGPDIHSLNHVQGTTTAAQEIDMWWRATLCLKQVDGAWSVVHSYASVPFDIESGIASVGLRPSWLRTA
jgi:ketosteroid isomerase-like protein